jgi:hypothetical protein
MGYASMFSDKSTCDMNIYGNVKDGWLSITQDLNYTYNNITQSWNCFGHVFKTYVRTSLALFLHFLTLDSFSFFLFTFSFDLL